MLFPLRLLALEHRLLQTDTASLSVLMPIGQELN